jgi:uncharacterized membrane protein YdjX (TVP38/TMEM64 family)
MKETMTQPPNPATQASTDTRWGSVRLAFLVIAVAALIIAPFLLWGRPVEAMTHDFLHRASGRPVLAGMVLAGLLALDIVAPIPSSLVGTACGVVLGFPGGTITGLTGMTLGCALGYWIGLACRTPADRLAGDREMRRLETWQSRWGVWVLAAARPVPVLAEASILFAGLTRMPLRQVAPVVVLSNLGVSAAYAAVGAWAAQTHSFLLAFLGATVLPGVAIWLARRKPSPRLTPPSPQ